MNLLHMTTLEWAMTLIILALIVMLIEADRSRWDAVHRAEAAEQALKVAQRDLATHQLLRRAMTRPHDAPTTTTNSGATLHRN